jgi:hypothetical protein
MSEKISLHSHVPPLKQKQQIFLLFEIRSSKPFVEFSSQDRLSLLFIISLSSLRVTIVQTHIYQE